MAYRSENCLPLTIKYLSVRSDEDLRREAQGCTDVCLLILPPCNEPDERRIPLENVGALVSAVADNLGPDATLITVGEVVDLVQVQANAPSSVHYQHWIVIKRRQPKNADTRSLPNYHFGALIHSRYASSLRHTKTRVAYTFCPVCDKTTKDYGGKKHTYHEYGTLVSDVWRDVPCDLEGDLAPLFSRFQDLFGIKPYKELLVLDGRQMTLRRAPLQYRVKPDWTESFIIGRENSSAYTTEPALAFQVSFLQRPGFDLPGHTQMTDSRLTTNLVNQVLHGDCLEWLARIPDETIDFVFTDPPYNLGKKYTGYTDDLEIKEYFEWCDLWIAELARVLKPGRTLALLNIPFWAVRHFLFMDTILQFQNWIAWDALAFPARFIMPAHYTILAFTKGPSRELPALTGQASQTDMVSAPDAFRFLEPLAEEYCLRSHCVQRRQREKINDRGPLTDLWWDIHRLKHNSRRVDHPTQLPPYLMYRLISIFTQPGEVVLDCFNGAGTTTLAAHQLGRRYIGIEKSQSYYELANSRHAEIKRGIDPFRKAERKLTAKNSPVPRMPKQKYEVSKKTLQLEVRRVARELGHLPSRAELAQYGKYPIKYYDEYFVSWGEVCAAARTTGMTEIRASEGDGKAPVIATQLSLGLDQE
jgi:site-specific DNA-methyltransferase (adenine-specific)